MASRKELMAAVGQRYRSATGVEKRQILDEFVALTGYHRKHALRVLNHVHSTGFGVLFLCRMNCILFEVELIRVPVI